MASVAVEETFPNNGGPTTMLMWIERRQVRIGMFVERLEGSWLDHPYWSERFLLSEAVDVRRLHDSKVSGVLINLSKGVGPVEEDAAEDRRGAARSKVSRPDGRVARVLDRSQRFLEDVFQNARLGGAIDMAATAGIVDEITQAVQRNPFAVLQMTRLKTRDACTFQHSVAVCALMIQFARYLGRDEQTVRELGMGGLFHDIGKVTMPARVLAKAAPLSPGEMELMRVHPIAGHAFLCRQPDVPETVRQICLKHHERIDGCGYPNGVAAEDLGEAVRMASICDVYDAVTSVRPYKASWSSARGLANMLSWTGQFDQLLLLKFAASLGTRLVSNRSGETVPNEAA